MPPKKTQIRPFSWATGHGQLTDHAHGVIFGMKECGKSVADIAKMMNVARKTVYCSLKASNILHGASDAEVPVEDDDVDGAESPKTTHQREIDERREVIDEMMMEKDENGKFVVRVARDVRKRLREEGNIISLRSVHRDIAAMGHRWKAMPVMPGMKPCHIAKRLEMVDYLESIDHRDILFSDEAYFDCSDHHRRAWQRDGEPQQERPREKYTSKVMVWGVIGINFSVLVLLNENVCGETYTQTLKKFLFPRIDKTRHVFMHDNAGVHTCKVVTKFLDDNEINRMTWPAKSPDLNPIEGVWHMMKSRIDVDLHADVEELEQAVMDAWDSISQEELNKLVESFPHRLKILRDRKGANVQKHRCYL